MFSSCFSTQQYCMVIFKMPKAIFSSSWSFFGAHLGGTIPFKTIKISCINTAYTMGCDLRKRWNHCHRRTCHERTKSTQHYYFFLLLLLFQYTEIALSAASTPIYFSQNSDFKILDGCLKVLKDKVWKNVKIYQLILGQIVENHKKFL